MKAAFIERHGGPAVLKFGEMPDPVAASGEVVVDIVAASVNGVNRLAKLTPDRLPILTPSGHESWQ